VGETKFPEPKKKELSESVKKAASRQANPIVGIGASAGGLEAITSLLEQLQPSTGLTFAIIQHLANGQESMLPSILARSTKMPVLLVKDEMHVEPNHVM
jgi:two-component system CheB/CheR fusion protein